MRIPARAALIPLRRGCSRSYMTTTLRRPSGGQGEHESLIGISNRFLDGRGEAAGVADALGVRRPRGFAADQGEKRREEVRQRVGR
jgi:hypothetical protein